MKVYIYSQHIIALIISLGQNMVVQNVILPRGLYFFTLFAVLFLSFIHGFLPARGRKTDYIIYMSLASERVGGRSRVTELPCLFCFTI